MTERVSVARDAAGVTAAFDVVAQGTHAAGRAAAAAIVQPIADAGATWWIEADWSAVDPRRSVRARIDAGPPRVS